MKPLLKFKEDFGYGRTGRVAYVADVDAFLALQHEHQWKKADFDEQAEVQMAGMREVFIQARSKGYVFFRP